MCLCVYIVLVFHCAGFTTCDNCQTIMFLHTILYRVCCSSLYPYSYPHCFRTKFYLLLV